MENLYAAFGFNKRDNASFVAMTLPVALGALAGVAVVGFVRLHGLTGAAHRAAAHSAHGFAQAVHHEPSRFIGDADGAVNFVGADAVLARIEHVSGHPPFRERNLAALKNGANSHGELALTVVAIVEAGASGLALHLGNLIGVATAAMAAERTIRPQYGL